MYMILIILQDQCEMTHIDDLIVADVDNPLLSGEVRKIMNRKYPREMLSRQTPVSCTYSDLAGSRMSKVFL